MTKIDRQGQDQLHRYVPALRFHWLTPLYDTTMRLFMREQRFRALVIQHAALVAGQRVLDFGCGTGTLTVMLKQACPEATVVGLDIDPQALGIAQKKAGSARADIRFHLGSVATPPAMAELAPASFDRIVSCLVFHHLTIQDKRRALDAAYALLKPGGELLIADWGKPSNLAMRAAFLVVQLLDGFVTTADNVQGRLPALIRDAGFADVVDGPAVNTVFGTLELYRSRKAG